MASKKTLRQNPIAMLVSLGLATVIAAIVYSMIFLKPNPEQQYLATHHDRTEATNDLNPTLIKITQLTTHSDSTKNAITSVIKQKNINQYDLTISVENPTILPPNGRPSLAGHQIIIDNDLAFSVYAMNRQDEMNDDKSLHAIISLSHSVKNIGIRTPLTKDAIHSNLLIQSTFEMEIIDFVKHNGKMTLFYTEKHPPKHRELIGRKNFLMATIEHDKRKGLRVKQTKKIKLPDHTHLFKMRVIPEDTGFTLIYILRVNQKHGKAEIIMSKTDKELNITYSTYIPIDLPQGVYNNLEATSLSNTSSKIKSRNYALVFSYTVLEKNESSFIAIFFDEKGNLNTLPFMTIDPLKPDGYNAEDIKVIGYKGSFFVLYKYEETGYYMSEINASGDIKLSSIPVTDESIDYYKSAGISLDSYDNKIICFVGDTIKVFQKDKTDDGSTKLNHKKFVFDSEEVYLYKGGMGSINIDNDTIGVIFSDTKNKSYSSVFKYSDLF